MDTRGLAGRYLTYAELTASLHELAAARPDRVSLESLLETPQGRKLWAVTVTDPRTGPPGDKPAMYVDANIHAGELAGGPAAMLLLQTLIDQADQEPIATLLARSTFYVVPRIAVDAVEALLQNHPYVRSAVRPYPTEDPPKGLVNRDLDGDGRVRQMRIPDPAGGWMASPEDERLLVPRPFDALDGRFYRLMSEGLVEGEDPRLFRTAQTPFQLDFNRNFPANWQPEKTQRGAGVFPLSEPETRAIADFIKAHPNICGAQALHTGIQSIVPPEGTVNYKDFDDKDKILLGKIGRRGAELTSLPYLSLMEAGYEKCHGDFSEWLYQHLGIPAFVVELWGLAEQAGVTLADYITAQTKKPEKWPEIELKTLKWAEEELGEHCFAPWTPFEHPQLGAVEIGGWDDALWRSPPEGERLADISKRAVDFILSQAAAAPRLQILSADAIPLGPNHIQIEVLVENQGFLPTYLTTKGAQNGAIQTVKAQLILGEGCALVGTNAHVDVGHLSGRGGRALLRWTVSTPDPTASAVTVVVDAQKGGRLSVEIPLS